MTDKPVRRLRAAGAGRSGRSDISERMEELLTDDTHRGRLGGGLAALIPTGETVNHPQHYNAHPSGVECIEVARLCPFDMGNAIKYIWRYEHKSGPEDLRKARFYLNDVLHFGLCQYLPYKARHLLEQVTEHETNPTRRELFLCILRGGVREAVDLITAIVGEEAS